MLDHLRGKSWLWERAIDASRNGIVITDPNLPDDPVVYTNPAFERMTGYAAEEIIGKNCRFLQGIDRDQPAVDEVRAAVADGRECQVVVRNYMKDGTQFCNELSISPIHDDEGRLINFIGVLEDVTEQKQLEDALWESNRQATNILESISDAFYALDRDWRFTYVNAKAERLLERSQEELLGRNIWEEFPDVVGLPSYARFKRVMADRSPAEFEEFYAPLGSWFATRVFPSEDGLSVYFRDVTGRKEAEQERERLLAESERRAAELDAVIRSIPDAVYIGTGEGIQVCNAVALEMLGFQSIEELNQNIAVLSAKLQNRFASTGERIAPEEEPFARALRGETVVEEVIARHLETERDVIVRCAAAPIWHEGRIVGAVAVNTDITEAKRAEAAFIASHMRIEDTLESITDGFVAVDREWRYTYVNERALRRLRERKGASLTREEILGQRVWGLLPEAEGTALQSKLREALRDQKTVEFEEYYPPSDEWIEVHVYPSDGGLSIYYRDITERRRWREEIETRTRQQAAVAALGLRALTEADLQSVLDEAVILVARTLDVEHAKIMELLSGEELLMRAGVGWREGIVGSLAERAGFGSQAGYTLLAEEPVVAEDLETETRFSPSALLREHEVRCGVSVVIYGREKPFGVLGAHTRGRRTFSGDDVNFLQAVANVLAARVEREVAEEQLQGIREAERSRVARDLHDEALGDLTYALAEAQHIQSISTEPGPTERLDRLVSALKRVGPQLRGAIYDLRLGAERDRSFSGLLESLVVLHRGMAPELEITLEAEDGNLSETLGETGTEILRVVGEALTNARRHSRATRVRVSAQTSGNVLSAEIADDGVGFDPAEQEEPGARGGGTGIRGMRERMRDLGGELEIRSEPGAGTTVRLVTNPREGGAEPEEVVRILLVEDHAAVREAVASALVREPDFEVVGQAGTLAEARELLRASAVDVAIVDLGLPDGYGSDLIGDLRDANPQAQALVLSASLDRAETARAVENGAAGVLNKTAHLDEVVRAIRRLKAGETLLPLEEVVDLLRFASTRREEEWEARQAMARLTPRELEVLQALAEGLDSEGIARRLNIGVRTERNHVASVLSKLGVHSQLQALVFAVRHGMVEVR